MLVDVRDSLMSNSNSLGTHTSFGNQVSITKLLEHYEEEMLNYIYATPHIPPTMFELKLHHSEVKSSVLKMFDMYWAENDANKELIRGRLDSQIDNALARVVVKNMNEYKMCQTGFIIGWKCSVNKATNQDYRNTAVDDRF